VYVSVVVVTAGVCTSPILCGCQPCLCLVYSPQGARGRKPTNKLHREEHCAWKEQKELAYDTFLFSSYSAKDQKQQS